MQEPVVYACLTSMLNAPYVIGDVQVDHDMHWMLAHSVHYNSRHPNIFDQQSKHVTLEFTHAKSGNRCQCFNSIPLPNYPTPSAVRSTISKNIGPLTTLSPILPS
jgi:hypothetical protein